MPVEITRGTNLGEISFEELQAWVVAHATTTEKEPNPKQVDEKNVYDQVFAYVSAMLANKLGVGMYAVHVMVQ